MTSRTRLIAFLVALGLAQLSPHALFSQNAKWKFPITVRDQDKITVLWIGLNPTAHFCGYSTSPPVPIVFGTCDTVRESELPPAPPSGVFDARFKDDACSGEGSAFQIQPSNTDSNLFQIKFSRIVATDTIYLSWPSGIKNFAAGIKF